MDNTDLKIPVMNRMFHGDFGFEESLTEIETLLEMQDRMLNIYSLNWEQSLPLENDNIIKETDPEQYQQITNINLNGFAASQMLSIGRRFGMEYAQQRDYLPKQHLMETRSYERALMSYDHPPYLTPHTTPTEIDLEEKKNRRKILSTEPNQEQIKQCVDNINIPVNMDGNERKNNQIANIQRPSTRKINRSTNRVNKIKTINITKVSESLGRSKSSIATAYNNKIKYKSHLKTSCSETELNTNQNSPKSNNLRTRNNKLCVQLPFLRIR